MEFPRSVIERIGTYVYALKDPQSGEIFYVGKGTGNRVFAHAAATSPDLSETEKISRIRAIHAAGLEVRYEILRHGMTDDQAFEVESALIDFIGLEGLANIVAGMDADRRGRMTVNEVIAQYDAKPIVISEPSILVIINRLFRRNMTPEQLYEATRGNWVLSERRNRAKYVFSVYNGVVRQVYAIRGWSAAIARSPTQKVQNRWRFEGEVATDLAHYIGGNVQAYLKPGAQSPTRYLNCQRPGVDTTDRSPHERPVSLTGESQAAAT